MKQYDCGTAGLEQRDCRMAGQMGLQNGSTVEWRDCIIAGLWSSGMAGLGNSRTSGCRDARTAEQRDCKTMGTAEQQDSRIAGLWNDRSVKRCGKR